MERGRQPSASRSRSRSLGILGLLTGALLLGGPIARASPAVAARCRPLAARTLERLIRSGRPVVETTCVDVAGELRLPSEVRSTLVLQHSRLHGLNAAGTTFSSPIDLSSTTIAGPATFTFADFGRIAVFDHTTFSERASFAGAEFHGDADFSSAGFGSRADFAHSTFDEAAGFAFGSFGALASFAGTDFRSVGDFTGRTFAGPADFTGARFGDARFEGAIFDSKASVASFLGAAFEGGGDFTSAFFRAGGTFDRSRARGDLDFHQAIFGGAASFSTVHYTGSADFSGADFQRDYLSLDQSTLHALDLGDATFHKTAVYFPNLGRTREIAGRFIRGGRINELKLDPNVVGRIQVGDEWKSRQTHERVLGLIETESRRGNDLTAANQARVLRLGLERASWPPGAKQFNLVVMWGIGGYLIRPSHPALAIVGLLLLGIGLRWWSSRRARRNLGSIGRGLWRDLRSALSALWQIKPKKPSWWFRAESVAHKILLTVLVVSLGNVSPPIRNLVEGLLP